MEYSAVIFDLDGTLLDTLEDLADSMNTALAAQALPTHPLESYKVFVGDGLEMFTRRSLGQRGTDDELVRRTIELQRDRYARCWADRTRPYPGIADLLDALTARALPMSVLSNKPHPFTLKCVHKLLKAWRFAAVEGAQDGVPRKPDPAAAVAIAARLNVPCDRILYLGDTNTDMQTAVAAGMYAVGVLWGFRQGAELTAAGAQTLLAHPMDLLKLL
ncbi:MAG: HAD-IA family hydrolase [Planctomycetaceae bacterium]|nr:HAD-IA family hydrolase [Planctomycetaceae bacterium]